MTKRKRKLNYLIIVVVVLLILYNPILSEFIPVSRTHFTDYSAFYEKAEYNFYLESLPESAHNVKYYAYEGFLADKSAYRATYSQTDYADRKNKHLAFYHSVCEDSAYYFTGSKQTLNMEQVQDKNIDFITKVLPAKQFDNFYFLTYLYVENSSSTLYVGVLCNDETCEIVEFTYRTSSSL